MIHTAVSTADGSVLIVVDADVSEADKELAALKKEIKKLENELDRKNASQNGLEKELIEANRAADEAAKKVQNLRSELEEVRNIIDPQKTTFGEVDPDTYINALNREKEITSELETQERILSDQEKQLEKVAAKYQAEDESIGQLTTSIDLLKDEAGALQNKIDSGNATLKEFSDNAKISDENVVNLRKELAQLKKEQKFLEGLDLGLGVEPYDQNFKRQKEIERQLKSYQKELVETQAQEQTAHETSREQMDRAMKEAEALTAEMEAVVEQERAAAEESARLREIADNAEISNQYIVDLNKELAELKDRQKELMSSGVGFGHTEYDQNAARIADINRELKEYQKTLAGTASQETSSGIEAPISRASLAAQKMNSVVSKSKNLLKTAGEAGSKAFHALSNVVRKTASGVAKAGKNAVSFIKKFNAFSKIADSLSGKFKRLGNTIKSALVFSVLYKGLSLIREQVGKYLSVNTQFMTALRRLQGVLLTAFQPIYEVVVPALTTLINVLARAVATVTQFFASLFGTTAKQAQTNAKDLYEQANATTAAGDAAEEAAKQMAGFDEINKLDGNKSAGGGGSTSVDTGPLFDYEYDETPFASWGEAFSAFLDKLLGGIPKLKEAFGNFADWFNNLNQKLYDMFTFPGVLEKVKQLGRDLADALNYLVDQIDWELWGRALGAGLNLGLNFLTSFLYAFDWMNLGKRLAQFVNGLVYEIDWYEFGRLLWAGFKIGLETLAGFLLGLDMPALAQAASNVVIGFFTEMKNTLDNIPWREIGEKIRDFLVNIQWGDIFDAVWGAIRSALTASSEFFSGLLGEELKRQITDMLITISKATLVIGALLALSGANVPLGLGLMAAGAASLAVAAVLDWEYVLGNIQSIITQVLAILGGALLVIGAILCFSGANVLLGIGLMAAGAVSLAAAAAINWDILPNNISGIVSKIALILGGALLVLGGVLAFSSANIPLGIGLMVAGAASLAAAVAINWESIVTAMQGTIGKITAIVSAALLALGAVLCFTGAGIPLGLGLIAAGAVGLAASIAANWDTIQPKIQGALDAVKVIASAALLAIGVILLFTGAAIPLGLGMIGVGAKGLASVIDPDWGAILEKLRGVWSDIQNWWDTHVKKFFTADYWKDLGKGILDGFLGGLSEAFKAVADWVQDKVDWIANKFSGATSSVSGSTGNSRFSGTRPSFGSREMIRSMPDISNFEIPALAKGAVIPPNREFLAVLGDQKNGTNIEAPVSEIENAVARAMRAAGNLGGTRPITVILQVDKRELGRVVYEVNNSETQRVGMKLAEAHT